MAKIIREKELKQDEVEKTATPLILLMQLESGRQSCLKIDLFSGEGMVKFQKLGMQEITSIAGQAGEIFERLAGYAV